MEFPADFGRIVDVLQHLGAQRDIEATIFEGQVLGGRHVVNRRAGVAVNPHMSVAVRLEPGAVRFRPTAHVDEAKPLPTSKLAIGCLAESAQ
jgi:hypothetical protein